eukprot:TRINITY_DN718_c5_g1_i1.p1 TRINITY_DN718_c5_g1~~TRINITY_DN718_c5_g1_i1.p1  ORF type:complete len:193 (+),score=38.93 TRINITY_DN718_c5_g1_i1:59-580(+)
MTSINELESKKEEITLKMEALVEARSTLEGMGERLEEVNAKIFHAEKERQDKLMRLEKEISIHELKVVEEVMKRYNKRTIDMVEMSQLQILKSNAESERLREKREFAAAVKTKVDLESRMMELKFQQDFAREEATLKSSENEIQTLKNTISGLQRDIAAQKVLSGQLATARVS